GAETAVRPASVRAFCVDGAAVVPLGEAAPTCALSAALKLAIGNRGAYPHVFVVGLQDDHTPRWYLPRPPETKSVAAPERDAGEVPIGAAVRLAVNHHAGPLRVHALFSEAPLDAREVEAAFHALAAKGVSAVDAVELPLARRDVVQRSVLVEVAP
ncbi:hypothetical protein L6R52_30240, partial [Myxococcota bacterium]|nr:hypothetical protein [Myxococcota bacterium]